MTKEPSEFGLMMDAEYNLKPEDAVLIQIARSTQEGAETFGTMRGTPGTIAMAFVSGLENASGEIQKSEGASDDEIALSATMGVCAMLLRSAAGASFGGEFLDAVEVPNNG